MLNNIRNFSKTIFAKILLVIIVIPFVFWGMGGVFNTGNTNNIVKINNYNISTQDFIDFLNSSKINNETIKENIDNNILEELLAELISKTLLDMEVKELNISISEKSLVKRIKKNENFLDDNKKFSRTEYEKFLLLNNLTAPGFEAKLKNNELKKKLFAYVSGGIKSPFFITNKTYKDQTGKLMINFINLDKLYKTEDSFSVKEIELFVKENEDQLKEEYIDFTYIKINPENLIGSKEFNKLFFQKIDEIENKISDSTDFNQIAAELNIKPVLKTNYILSSKNDEIEEKIYNKRNENIVQLFEENDFYILYKINKIQKILPSINNDLFKNKVKKILFRKNKYEYNEKLLTKINNSEFKQSNFEKLSSEGIEALELNSVRDNSKFSLDSVKLLYSLPINAFALIGDDKKNIYIAKTKNITVHNIKKSSKVFLNYNNQANIKMRNNIYASYDFFLNEKYKVNVNEKTLERVKNYFR